VPCRLLHTVLWLAFGCALAQICPNTPVPTTVSSTAGATALAKQLATAFDCPKAEFSAVWQGNVTLTESIIVGNGTSLTIRGTAADTAVVNGNGTVQMFVVWGTLTAANMTLINGLASDIGGAIRVRLSANFTIADSALVNNSAANRGGAVFVGNKTTTIITGCTFDLNKARATSGGSVAAGYRSNLTVSTSSFSNNIAGFSGGAIYADNKSTVALLNSVFFTNGAQYGGAVGINSSSTLATTNCTFGSNTAEINAVYSVDSCVLMFSNTNFTNNSAAYFGGAVCTDADNTVTVSNSAFSFNTAEDGGCISASQTQA
jgi:predicted outer membrane repeat protein